MNWYQVVIIKYRCRWWLGRDGFATRRCIFEEDTATPWYDERCPPIGLWIAENDSLVDGIKLVERLSNIEKDVLVVNQKIIPRYEHLDVLWAIDAVEQVGKGVKEVIWMTAHRRAQCRCPEDCEDL